MSVEIGENLRHYSITAKIGAGGMGEVYRAKDTVLGREVAIKILPEEFSSDPDRLGRFEREAKVLASMNHPHIAQIYGLEEDRERRFLVLELVDGETLASRIRRGAIAIEESLSIALQIAEALETAHGRGIIHRDLKPANIMLTPEGEAKVLDFGIAKPLATASTEDEAETHTLTTPPTRAGVLIGTPTYMSPEQVRGQGVDRRSDIWAFGVVLWEMLTGARLFEGDTDSDILLAVMQEDPDWQELPPGTPPAVRRLLRRCLERDPSKRLHDIADARLEIEEALAEPNQDSRREVGPQSTTRWQRVRGARPVYLVGLALGLLVAVLMWRFIGLTPPAPRGTQRVALTLPTDMTIRAGIWRPALAISPDGRWLVFEAWDGEKNQLYKRSLEQFHAAPVPGTEDGFSPFFSPDGHWFGFFADGKLKRVPLAGGPPQIITDAPNPFGASWGPDETIVFNRLEAEGLWQVPATGGAPDLLVTPDFERGEWDINWPEFLPDGKAVLFTSFRGMTADTAQIEVLDLESRARKTLVEGVSYARYVPTGHLIFGRGDGIHVAPFDADSREITGPTVPVPDPIFFEFENGVPQLAISAGGSLAFVPGGGPPGRQLVSVDLEGRESPLIEARRGYMYPRFSPDGERLAVAICEPGDTNIWVVDLSTETHTKLTLKGTNVFPSWTPDGERVTYQSDRQGTFSIDWKRADGSGQSAPLVSPEHPGEWLVPGSWSPKGETLTYDVLSTSRPENGMDVWIAARGGNREPRPMVATGAMEFGAAISPNGRWLAYVSRESGRHEVYVQPYPGGGERHQISTDGGWMPVWSPDGGSIYFQNDNRILAVTVSTTPRFRAGAARALFEDRYELGFSYTHANFDIAPDGKSFVMVKPDEEWGRATEIRVIFNWFEELERLAPPG